MKIFSSSPNHWSQVGQSQKGCTRGKEVESHRALAERTVHQGYVCLQASTGMKHNKQVAIFFQSYSKMFPKSVSTASQSAWYFVMPQTLTSTDTRNPARSFIHLQWKHNVFNSKDVSITFRDFFHFGTAVLWQIAKERNSVVTAWFCSLLKPFCPGLCVLSPYPGQLSVTQGYSAFCTLEPFLLNWPCY